MSGKFSALNDQDKIVSNSYSSAIHQQINLKSRIHVIQGTHSTMLHFKKFIEGTEMTKYSNNSCDQQNENERNLTKYPFMQTNTINLKSNVRNNPLPLQSNNNGNTSEKILTKPKNKEYVLIKISNGKENKSSPVNLESTKKIIFSTTYKDKNINITKYQNNTLQSTKYIPIYSEEKVRRNVSKYLLHYRYQVKKHKPDKDKIIRSPWDDLNAEKFKLISLKPKRKVHIVDSKSYVKKKVILSLPYKKRSVENKLIIKKPKIYTFERYDYISTRNTEQLEENNKLIISPKKISKTKEKILPFSADKPKCTIPARPKEKISNEKKSKNILESSSLKQNTTFNASYKLKLRSSKRKQVKKATSTNIPTKKRRIKKSKMRTSKEKIKTQDLHTIKKKKKEITKVVTRNSVQNLKIMTRKAVQDSKVRTRNSVQDSKVMTRNSVQDSKVMKRNSVQNSKAMTRNSVQDSKVLTRNSVQDSKVTTRNSVQDSKVTTRNSVQNSKAMTRNSVQDSKVMTRNSVQDSKVMTRNSVQNSKVRTRNIMQISERFISSKAKMKTRSSNKKDKKKSNSSFTSQIAKFKDKKQLSTLCSTSKLINAQILQDHRKKTPLYKTSKKKTQKMRSDKTTEKKIFVSDNAANQIIPSSNNEKPIENLNSNSNNIIPELLNEISSVTPMSQHSLNSTSVSLSNVSTNIFEHVSNSLNFRFLSNDLNRISILNDINSLNLGEKKLVEINIPETDTTPKNSNIQNTTADLALSKKDKSTDTLELQNNSCFQHQKASNVEESTEVIQKKHEFKKSDDQLNAFGSDLKNMRVEEENKCVQRNENNFKTTTEKIQKKKKLKKYFIKKQKYLFFNLNRKNVIFYKIRSKRNTLSNTVIDQNKTNEKLSKACQEKIKEEDIPVPTKSEIMEVPTESTSEKKIEIEHFQDPVQNKCTNAKNRNPKNSNHLQIQRVKITGNVPWYHNSRTSFDTNVPFDIFDSE